MDCLELIFLFFAKVPTFGSVCHYWHYCGIKQLPDGLHFSAFKFLVACFCDDVLCGCMDLGFYCFYVGFRGVFLTD